MNSKSLSIALITLFIVLRISVAMPVEGIQGENGKPQSQSIGSRHFGLGVPPSRWSNFGSPRTPNRFRPINMARVMMGRVAHGAKDKPESYWFNRTITAGTKVLKKFEEWKHRYPRTLGVPLGLVLRFF